MILLDFPTITDWIQATGAMIGIPGAIAAFIILFRKDRDKERLIESLVELTHKQDDVINQMNAQLLEFAQQTHELKSQTHIASIGNILLGDQVKVLSEHFNFAKDLSISRQEQAMKDRKDSLRPNFIYKGGTENVTAKYQIDLENVGGEARDVQPFTVSDKIMLYFHSYNKIKSTTVANGEMGFFYVNYDPALHLLDNHAEFYFSMRFTDNDGIAYEQTILYQNQRFQITEVINVES